ncbi:hypothetical protein LTR86_011153 [Recurvomyces mirabilis]|nr:hypothetical protein LTR86_011153 [Recurvomyces mirabilis]
MYSLAQMRSIINHVFLPPQLPQEEDECDTDLVKVTLDGIRHYRSLLLDPVQAVNDSIGAVERLLTINSLVGAGTSEEELRSVLGDLSEGQYLAVKVHAQNAAILISRIGKQLIFETFELSPRNQDVLDTKGRLLRTFPGLAVAVDIKELQQADFVATIAHTISLMSSTAVPEMQPQSKKARQSHNEDRDTTDPGLVAELLIGGILRGFGSPAKVSSIPKKTREEVLWDNARRPWRRSSMWLLLRVVIQLVVERAPDGSRRIYKEIMICIMSNILERAMETTMPSDILHVMNVKIARRVHKLAEQSTTSAPGTLSGVRKILVKSADIIAKRWEDVQARDGRTLSMQNLESLDLDGDATMDLPALDQHIEHIMGRRAEDRSYEFHPPAQLNKHHPSILPSLPQANSEEIEIAVANLQQFEQWVALYLQSWLVDHRDLGTLVQIHTLMAEYHRLANKLYDGNPEAKSIMLLTIYEIWVACDTIGVGSCSLLADYDSEIPESVLQNLLLRFRDQMEQLQSIEAHLSNRRSQSIYPAAQLFDLSRSESLPSRYFDQSPTHSQLHSVILAQAERDRQLKREEFDQKKAEYKMWRRSAEQHEHEYIEVVVEEWGDYRSVEQKHVDSCEKCRCTRLAEKLTISVHEWPLPSRDTTAKGVIFELAVPSWFAHWRDVRNLILHDVLGGQSPHHHLRSSYLLSNHDPHLSRRYFKPAGSDRIGLLSEDKSFMVAHYKDKTVGTASVSDICVANGLNYHYYDTVIGRFFDQIDFSDVTAWNCTYLLPQSAQTIQRFLFRSPRLPDGPAPNEVIASQDRCPEQMSLEEFRELSTLPLGHRIQWANIMLQLAMPGIDFNKSETALVISQCINQAGPPGGTFQRESHADSQDEYFAAKILDQVEVAFDRMKHSWKSAQAVSVLIGIATRVSSLNRVVTDRSMVFLATVRAIVAEWTDAVLDRARNHMKESQKADLVDHGVKIAVICALTFDVDDDNLGTILSCPRAAAILIRCAMVVQRSRAVDMAGKTYSALLMFRVHQLFHRAYPLLSRNQEGLNNAIASSWPAFTPSAIGWAEASPGADHWMTTLSTPAGGHVPLRIHYNLLSGELLVNGKPFDHTPKKYLRDLLYRKLFGVSPLDVVPVTSPPGLSYAASRCIEGCSVYLGLSDDADTDQHHVIVRAVKGEHTYETIPAQLFTEELPAHFVDDYVHWYDVERDVVHFRPREAPWDDASPSQWLLQRAGPGLQWRCSRGETYLLGLKSTTCKAITTLLAPLAEERDMHHVVLEIDETLGRLVENGSLEGMIFLAYLHALTSFVLPDTFTTRSGTEQALNILTSAATRSFSCLTQRAADLLGQIARLSPRRKYYPPHKHAMQQVTWDNQLSFFSQQSQLCTAVSEIFSHARRMQLFHPNATVKLAQVDFDKEDLYQRDLSRTAMFRISGFGAEDKILQHDRVYKARDCQDESERSHRAAAIAALSYGNAGNLVQPVHKTTYLWPMLATADHVKGHRSRLNSEDIQYGPELLTTWQAFVSSNFLGIRSWLSSEANVRQHRYAVLTWLSTMAFSKSADLRILQALAAFMPGRSLSSFVGPDADSFNPPFGIECIERVLRAKVRNHSLGYRQSREHQWNRRRDESKRKYDDRRHSSYTSAHERKISTFVNGLLAQKHTANPETPYVDDVASYLRIEDAMSDIRPLFRSWHNNRLLYQYASELEGTIAASTVTTFRVPALDLQPPQQWTSVVGFVSVNALFEAVAPVLPMSSWTLESQPTVTCQERKPLLKSGPLLSSFVESLEQIIGHGRSERRYLADLEGSLRALQDTYQGSDKVDSSIRPAHVYGTYNLFCERQVRELYEIIESTLRAHVATSALTVVHHWPRISPMLLLEQLSRKQRLLRSHEWRKCLVGYGLALTAMQRARRLLDLAERPLELEAELRNVGHQNWSALEYPDSLLIEIEGGILIREEQEGIAVEMRNGCETHNVTMQMNMGDGKSSVIAPIVAADLADTSQLVRMIVAKGQSKQMAHTLIARLGGLVDRRIYYMPVSRSLRFTKDEVLIVAELLRECMSEGGVLLVQPEHILSFQLMAAENAIDGTPDTAKTLLSVSRFLDDYARDIVDECDENFSTRFELVYTMGTQRTIEFSPDRWIVFHQILDVVNEILPSIQSDSPQSIKIGPRSPGIFPRCRIQRPDAGTLLMGRIADHICRFGLEGFPIARQPPEVRKAACHYMVETEVNDSSMETLEAGGFLKGAIYQQLLLLRGLLAGGILVFALSRKRWRVSYGRANRLPPTRLAVPYRARDTPTQRSEFSHPDVGILLTTLCYYYDGLNNDDLLLALNHLMESDRGDIEYQSWVREVQVLPSALRHLQGINLKDELQCASELFPYLRYVKKVVDYFLSHIVFPKEIKEFPTKLSTSGWNIGKTKKRILSGFSGTCDSRHLLPLAVRHLDLPRQQHTNALVLEYLLQPQNSVHMMDRSEVRDEISDAEHVLNTVLELERPTQVILDVGAQILELSNLDFAREWLRRTTDIKKAAVVYLNDFDEICVVDRQGRSDLLHTSPFNARLEACLVFLDDAHTRGIDLKLPRDYRAAVILGPHVTKDRLVQACMRMRQLGKGQTLAFCVPDEVRLEMEEMMAAVPNTSLGVEEILKWAIMETQSDIRRSTPLWAVQGRRFLTHERIWAEAIKSGGTSDDTSHMSELLEDEARSMEIRYGTNRSSNDASHLDHSKSPAMKEIANRCAEFEGLSFRSSSLHEEQERELSPEIEQERQIQRAPPATAEKHQLHPDLSIFVETGVINLKSTGYFPAYQALDDSSIAQGFDLSQLDCAKQMFVTSDFARTVRKDGVSYQSDAFQRPVQWILTGLSSDSTIVASLLLISPYEANLLYRTMKSENKTSLHVYKPRTNAAYRALDDLSFYSVPCRPSQISIPRMLALQLDLFAGQLYLSSYSDYMELCRFLGLYTGSVSDAMAKSGWIVAPDGFINRDGEGRVGGESGLTKSPVSLARSLLSKIRRDGRSIAGTHMGSLLNGQLLRESEFSIG